MTKTADEIYYEMRDEFISRSGVTLREDGDMAIRLRALAAQVHSLWMQGEWLRRQCFPQTAEGSCLDLHAQIRGLERRSPVSAGGFIRFEISAARTIPLHIPQGTVCITQAEIEFETTEAGIIEQGELFCDIPAKAVNAGLAGNVPPESIIFMVGAPAGIESCYNPNSFSGGIDAEDDLNLRSRVLESYRRLPNGANVAYYETQALSVDAVAAVTVLPKARGVGTVDIVICTEEGLPSQELINSVSDRLNAQREICVDIEVGAPETLEVDVSIEIAASDKLGFAEASARTERELRGYFNGRLLGKDILRAQLAKIIYDIEGIINYRIIEPVMDVSVGKKVLPSLGALDIREMGS